MAFHFTIKDASIQDTLQYIRNFINKYSTDPFVINLAKEFDASGDKQQFVKRLFNYICENGFYELDEDGHEEVWTPALTIRTRNAAGKFQYDCKKITILLGSVLKAAGIEPVLKHIYYKNDGGENDGPAGYKMYTHIYIVVPMPDMDNYLVVDPTNNCMWNSEVDHEKATLHYLNGQTQDVAPMDLHLMGNNNRGNASPSLAKMFGESAAKIEDNMNVAVGCPGNHNSYNYEADLIGWKNQYFSFTTANKVGHIAKRALLAIPRNAFLGLLYLGKLLANTPLKLNWAARLARSWQRNKSVVRKTWWLLGGTADARALQKAIIKGSGISISGPHSSYESVGQGFDYPIDVVTPYLRELKAEGIGAVTFAAATAAIAVATPVLFGLFKMMKNMGTAKEGEVDPPVPNPGTPGGGPSPEPPRPPLQSNMLDFSSPHNAIVKAVFLMGVSGIITGPSFYILNVFCIGTILYSFIRLFRWKVTL